MPSQALHYAAAHHRSRDEAHAVANGLSSEAFAWRPAPGAWSIGECLAHLNAVAEAYLPPLDAAVARGHERGRTAEGPFAYGWLADKLRAGVAPGGPALTTGRALDPSRSVEPLAKAAVVGAFDDLSARLAAVCERADGLDLAGVKVRYPFMRLLRLPLGAFLDITGQHALRHTAQARRVASAPGFPA